MIIGIDASRAVKKHKTGVEWYARHVIENLIKIDEKNQFVLYIPKTPDTWLQSLSARSNVRVKRLRWFLPFFWTQGRLSWEMFRRPPEVFFLPASAMPLISPKNTVAVVHDVGFMAFAKAYGFGQRLYLRWSTRRAVKRARKIITISEFSKTEIIKYFKADADKIVVTPLGYDKDIFNHEVGEAQDVLEKYRIAKPYLLYVGRLETKKNILNMLKAFISIHKYKKYQLVLAGSIGFGFAEIFEFIKLHNLAGAVRMTGYASEKDLAVLYRQATAFLFPSLYEGFGLPVLEAMACGTPVICSDTTSLPEITGDAAELVPPNNHKAISDKIIQVLADERLRDNLAYKGLQRAGDFSWVKCAQATSKALIE